jgi:hypothetical protein
MTDEVLWLQESAAVWEDAKTAVPVRSTLGWGLGALVLKVPVPDDVPAAEAVKEMTNP